MYFKCLGQKWAVGNYPSVVNVMLSNEGLEASIFWCSSSVSGIAIFTFSGFLDKWFWKPFGTFVVFHAR